MPPAPAETRYAAIHEPNTLQSAEEVNLEDIWQFLLRRRRLVAAFAFIGLAGGFLITIRAPRLYTATATVELNKDSASGLGIQDLSGLASQVNGGQEFMTDMLTHQAVLLNDNTALSVIERLGLMRTHPYIDIPHGKLQAEFESERMLPFDQAPFIRDRALAIFRSGIRVVVVKNTRLLTISYTDTDRARATQIANMIVEAYLTNNTKARYLATSKASAWLTDQLTDLKRRVEESHKKVNAYEQATGLVGLTDPSAKSPQVNASQSSNSTAYQRLTALNAELSRAEVARIAKEAVYRLTLTTKPDVVLGVGDSRLVTGMDFDSPIAPGSRDMQLLQTLRTQEAMLKVRLAAEQVKYGSKNPELLQIHNQINSLNGQIRDEITRINSETKTDFLLARANEDSVRKSVLAQEQEVATVGNSLAALTFLQQEESTTRSLYQDLYTRLEEANIAAGVKSSDMVIVDPARVPSLPSSPVLKFNLAAGMCVGLFTGLLIAGGAQLRDTSLLTPEDFDTTWNTPMLGVVPRFTGDLRSLRSGFRKKAASDSLEEKTGETAFLLNAPKSQMAEAYRQIRTSIMLSNIDRPARVILFTSALTGDGKSTTAYNIAVAFGVQSKKVLLIDADLRRPVLGRKCGCNGPMGLSDLLANELPSKQVIQEHPSLPSLFIITAGTIPPMPAELLGSQRFVKLIDSLRADFDYILIDAPPVLLVTDPLLIASSVDGIVVVVRSGVTTKAILNRLSAAINKPKVNVLGYVLNGFDAAGQRYGYQHDYYGKNEYYEESPA